jgi:outer membrane receptor protein involved in Fe transport
MKKKVLLLLAALFCLALSAPAQTSRGTISGVVTDPNGAVITGAEVIITNAETNVSRSTVSNDEGIYRLEAVDPGSYSVKITAGGFGTVVKNDVAVNANQTSTVDTQLAPGTQAVEISVTAESGALLQTEAPVRGGNITRAQVTELPVSSRNPANLALTLPGVSSNRGGFGDNTFSINGARGRSNNFLIDGTENNDISVAGQGFKITNPDAVQEVSVQTSNYDSEFGRSGGGVINTITKGGTNEFHGTLSYLLDSRVDDAITSSESRDPAIAAGGLPFGIENIYSGTLGGPVYFPRFGEGGRRVYNGKNKTFFFVAYQEDRQRSNAQSQLTTPTAAGRARLQQLFPAGTNANVDLYLNATQSAVAVASPFNIALGNAGGGDRGNVEFGTFFRGFNVLNTDKQFQARIDSQLTDKDQFSARFLADNNIIPFGGTIGTSTFEGFDADSTGKYYNFLLADTHVFSSVFTNETRLAYNRIDLGFPITDPGGPGGTLPRVVIQLVTSLGTSTSFPQGRVANNYVVQDTATYVKGNHTFRGGVDFLRQISRQAAPFVPRGQVSFAASTGFTAFANFVDNFGGSGGTTAKDFGSAVYNPALYRTATFFQDRWKATEALTLTLGLRYEYFGTPFNTLRTPAYTGLFNVDPATRLGPYALPNQVQADRNNFAPTAGIAYSPSGEGLLGRLFGERKTVLRAGYQIGYDSFFNNIASNAAVSSPNIIATTLSSAVTSASPRGTSGFLQSLPTTAAALTPLSAQSLIAANLVNPYYQRWSAGVQRELPFNTVVDISYVGSKGTKLYISEDANPLVRPEQRRNTPAGYPNCTPQTNLTAAQANAQFAAGTLCPLSGRLDNIQGSRGVRTNGGSSSYHAGQIEVRRRFSDNFMLTGAYTFSKLIDNASEVFSSLGGGFSNQPLFQTPAVFGGDRLDRAVSLFDRPHRATFTYIIESPFFREQRGALGRILGGFQLSGVTTFESGVPFTVFNGLDSDGVGGSTQDRPNFNPLGQPGVRARPVVDAQGFITGYVNPDANNAPIDPSTARYIGLPTYVAGLAGSVPRTGNLGRNTERSPGLNNWNMNVMKKTRLSESTTLEFRTEFYNIFNHPQIGQGSTSPFSPSGNPTGSNFIASSVNTSTAGFFLVPNTTLADAGGRVIRYQLKLIF